MTKNARKPPKQTKKSLFLRILAVIGGGAGLVALAGLALNALGVLQTSTIAISDEVLQRTAIWISGEQLSVQRQIATVLAVNVQSDPTATAQRRQLETLNAYATGLASLGSQLSPATPAATAAASSVLAAADTQTPGVRVELLAFARVENTITARLRYDNTTNDAVSLQVTWASYVLDTSSGARWGVSQQSDTLDPTIPPGGSIEVWATYILGANADPKLVSLALPNGVLFENLALH